MAGCLTGAARPAGHAAPPVRIDRQFTGIKQCAREPLNVDGWSLAADGDSDNLLGKPHAVLLEVVRQALGPHKVLAIGLLGTAVGDTTQSADGEPGRSDVNRSGSQIRRDRLLHGDVGVGEHEVADVGQPFGTAAPSRYPISLRTLVIADLAIHRIKDAHGSAQLLVIFRDERTLGFCHHGTWTGRNDVRPASGRPDVPPLVREATDDRHTV